MAFININKPSSLTVGNVIKTLHEPTKEEFLDDNKPECFYLPLRLSGDNIEYKDGNMKYFYQKINPPPGHDHIVDRHLIYYKADTDNTYQLADKKMLSGRYNLIRTDKIIELFRENIKEQDCKIISIAHEHMYTGKTKRTRKAGTRTILEIDPNIKIFNNDKEKDLIFMLIGILGKPENTFTNIYPIIRLVIENTADGSSSGEILKKIDMKSDIGNEGSFFAKLGPISRNSYHSRYSGIVESETRLAMFPHSLSGVMNIISTFVRSIEAAKRSVETAKRILIQDAQHDLRYSFYGSGICELVEEPESPPVIKSSLMQYLQHKPARENTPFEGFKQKLQEYWKAVPATKRTVFVLGFCIDAAVRSVLNLPPEEELMAAHYTSAMDTVSISNFCNMMTLTSQASG